MKFETIFGCEKQDKQFVIGFVDEIKEKVEKIKKKQSKQFSQEDELNI